MELLVLVLGAAVLAVVGIGIGMLIAPRLDRWAAPRPPADSPATVPVAPPSNDTPEDERLDGNP